MSTGKVVWVLDVQRSAYYDAQPLLSARNIELILFAKDELGHFDETVFPLLIKQFGSPDLVIVGREYSDLQGLVMMQINNAPRVWWEHLRMVDADQPQLPIQDATTLITILQTHFFPEKTSKKPVLYLNPDKYSIGYNNQSIRLTPREFQIVNYLYKAPGHNVSRQDFFQQVWKGLKVCNKVLDVHVSNLRKKVNRYGIDILFVKPGSFEMSFREATSPEHNLDGSSPFAQRKIS